MELRSRVRILPYCASADEVSLASSEGLFGCMGEIFVHASDLLRPSWKSGIINPAKQAEGEGWPKHQDNNVRSVYRGTYFPTSFHPNR